MFSSMALKRAAEFILNPAGQALTSVVVFIVLRYSIDWVPLFSHRGITTIVVAILLPLIAIVLILFFSSTIGLADSFFLALTVYPSIIVAIMLCLTILLFQAGNGGQIRFGMLGALAFLVIVDGYIRFYRYGLGGFY